MIKTLNQLAVFSVIVAVLAIPTVTFADATSSIDIIGGQVDPSINSKIPPVIQGYVDPSINQTVYSQTTGGSFGGSSTQGPVFTASSTATTTASTTLTTNASTTATTKTIGNFSCPLLTKFITSNTTNDTAEVTALQNFLNSTNSSSTIAVTGNFDADTVAAVKAFQRAHVNDIMKPWGVVTPTGQVYITTLKKINEIACNKSIDLTSTEQAQIDAYKAGLTSTNSDGTTNNSASGATISVPAFSSTTDVVGDANLPDNSNLTANVTSSGLGNFFGNLVSSVAHFFGKR